MKIYIAKIDFSAYSSRHLNIHLSEETNFFEVYYQSSDGPLGFSTNESSKEIFKLGVENSMFYSELLDDFFILSKDDIVIKHSNFNGVFMEPTEFILKEIDEEKKQRVVKQTNILLQRHNKPLKTIIPTFFTDFYDNKSEKYFHNKIADLTYKYNVNILVSSHDSFGLRMTVRSGSSFYNKLIAACADKGISVLNVESANDVPPW